MSCKLGVVIIATLIVSLAGKDVESIRGRIVGGKKDFIKERPYMVSVQDNDGHKCGGSILAKNVILTADHCVPSGDPTEYKVYSGSSYTFKNGSMTRVKRIYRERESPTGNKADVAILELEEPLVFGSTRQPVKLWEAGWDIYINEFALVNGWNLMLNHSNNLWKGPLQTVVLQLVDWHQCAKIVPSQLKVHEMCAWIRVGRKDACLGESGGPVILVDGGIQAQVAVVAGGWECGQSGVPGIYTNIIHVRDWIDRILHAVELLNK